MEYAHNLYNVQGGCEPHRVVIEKQLSNLMHHTLEQVNFHEGKIRIERFGATAVPDSNASLSVTVGETTATHTAEISIPITYQRQTIGEITLISETPSFDTQLTLTDHAQQQLIECARHIGYLVKRHEASEFAKFALQKSMLLLGKSEKMHQVDAFIEQASQVSFPVLISGAFGTEKLHVACAIHFNGEQQRGTLMEVNCATELEEGFAERLEQWFIQAQGGTLFFNGIDQLSIRQQALLPQYIESHMGQWIGASDTSEQAGVRIIASATHELQALVEDGKFLRPLFAELNFLSIQLPTLSERAEDIPDIAAFMLEKYSLHQHVTFTPQAKHALQRYDWPENLFELERVIARLLTFCTEPEISVETLQTCVPDVIALLNDAEHNGSKEDVMQPIGEVIALDLLAGDFSRLTALHPGLQKALKYLSEHYTSDVSLTELSNNAFVSASHLSYLFKFHLGRTFKQVLAQMRIEHAKSALQRSDAMRITDVSLEVGFGDLSHFEKIFKRHVGSSPRDYRREHARARNAGVSA